MKLDFATLKKRMLLWSALSNLFLDTELQDSDLSYISQSMKDSGYELDEITNILMTEVFPVCISNMHSIAGEWAGFDEEWLTQEIMDSKPPSQLKQWFHRRSYWMIRGDWEIVIEKFKN